MKEEVVFKDDKVGKSSFIIKLIINNKSEEVVVRNLYTNTAAKSRSNKLNKDYKGEKPRRDIQFFGVNH